MELTEYLGIGQASALEPVLRPCPLCEVTDTGDYMHAVAGYWLTCYCGFETLAFYTKEEAATQWNLLYTGKQVLVAMKELEQLGRFRVGKMEGKWTAISAGRGSERMVQGHENSTSAIIALAEWVKMTKEA